MDADQDLRGVLTAARRIARAFDIQSRRIDREIGLTIPQYIVLACLGELGEVTSRALAVAADLSPPTVVGILDKLEAKGLIERYRSARDRRIVHARLTGRGRAALAAAPSPLGGSFRDRYMRLDAAERAALVSALERLGALLRDAETDGA